MRLSFICTGIAVALLATVEAAKCKTIYDTLASVTTEQTNGYVTNAVTMPLYSTGATTASDATPATSDTLSTLTEYTQTYISQPEFSQTETTASDYTQSSEVAQSTTPATCDTSATPTGYTQTETTQSDYTQSSEVAQSTPVDQVSSGYESSTIDLTSGSGGYQESGPEITESLAISSPVIPSNIYSTTAAMPSVPPPPVTADVYSSEQTYSSASGYPIAPSIPAAY